ncbi:MULTISPECIES: NAD(P)H-binding protein [Gammaproteobacteria]|uniref:NAD(P)H-binding protein n=1 Tax=Gammaproteobacteria TaxID=1236 RepID=UPI000DD0B762|nr:MULTISPECIES: NAD(P)H-binding protein [Gammaproteobacteria]RTE87081.1 NAD-dependent dehydratase [Aliidiomarina sp. B3213]TCZ93130.1 NAD-dependent dehydratase [Lysobacter sp. N42]
MKLAILGATGVVGYSVLQSALQKDKFSAIVAPSRLPLSCGDSDQKLKNPTHMDLRLACDSIQVDAAICALGTTLKQAGSKEKFQEIDKDLVIQLAYILKNSGCKHFAYVSSLGATPGRNFYLNSKYETEQALKAIGFESLTIVRPSLINHIRSTSRPAEKIGVYAARFLAPIIPRKYKAVKPEQIALSLIQSIENPKDGIHIVESNKL